LIEAYPELMDAFQQEGPKIVYKLIKVGGIDSVDVHGIFDLDNDGTHPQNTWSEFREKMHHYARMHFDHLPDLQDFEKFFADTIVDRYLAKYPLWPEIGCSQEAEIPIEVSMAIQDRGVEKYAHLIGMIRVKDTNVDGKLTCEFSGRVDLKALTVRSQTMMAQEAACRRNRSEYIEACSREYAEGRDKEYRLPSFVKWVQNPSLK
jgi:hypothetical protein